MSDSDFRRELLSGGADMALHIIEHMYDSVLIADWDGKVLECNVRARRMFGRDEAALRRLYVEDLVVGFNRELLGHVGSNLQSGRHTVINGSCRNAAGTSIRAEIVVTRLELGERSFCMMSIRDISKRMEELEMFTIAHSALQLAASGLAVTDLEGQFILVNNSLAMMCDYESADDLQKADIHKLFKGVAEKDEMLATVEQGDNWFKEVWMTTREDNERCIQINASGGGIAEGAFQGIVYSFMDVTELKKSEAFIRRETEGQLERAKEQAGDFSGSLAFIAIPELFQLIESSRKSGVLFIQETSGTELGSASFIDGQLVWAECGKALGEAAVYGLLEAGAEAFEFRQGLPDLIDGSLQGSTMGILLEAARNVDESAG